MASAMGLLGSTNFCSVSSHVLIVARIGTLFCLPQGQPDRVGLLVRDARGRGDLGVGLVLHRVEFPHHGQHLGSAAGVGVLGVEEVPPSVSPTSTSFTPVA